MVATIKIVEVTPSPSPIQTTITDLPQISINSSNNGKHRVKKNANVINWEIENLSIQWVVVKCNPKSQPSKYRWLLLIMLNIWEWFHHIHWILKYYLTTKTLFLVSSNMEWVLTLNLMQVDIIVNHLHFMVLKVYQ